ncbi:hypothetical protein H4R33_001573 [Dimargaris cristalligena]|uniref:rRNA adenine N(6)-methyltransferase n=1 Tax=Dimargaris cristalligena TaxID=215637 RepID=A0A4P9ZRF9_9FUNG|nr:hypothetical protein H4R33_001573 [Dimargaris cristalligena]RKP36116.1 mitochondrial transcription factor B-like protein [Dimargaris cristalligena]|eukprot:RKP36116.1 mitochondrial transcription factor B-like protein [Dimargaris cristalligena]
MGVRPLPRLPAVRDLIKLYGLSAQSQLSQNFILDKNITDKIARCADIGPSESVIVEVGPGPGLLTRSLLDLGIENMVAVEKDSRFLPTLSQLADASDSRLKVIQGDMLTVQHDDILKALGLTIPQTKIKQVHILGNLPFSVATPLLAQWLGGLSARTGIFASFETSMTLMFQKEVAERIVAPVSTSPRGRLSVAAQSLCHTNLVYRVPADSFVPRPKVDAAVVHLVPLRESLLKVTFPELEHVSRFLFSSRRKTLRRIMKNLDSEAPAVLDQCQMDGNLRPQDLTNEAFNTLARAIVDSKLTLPP